MLALHDFLLRHNDIGRLRELLKAEDPNSRDSKGRTPLHRAVIKCELNPEETNELQLVVQELINFGATVDLKDEDGCTPLHLAVMCRNWKLVETLLGAGAKVDCFSNNGYNTLHYATKVSKFPRDGHESKSYNTDHDVVRILLRKNPDVDLRNFEDETPLMFAVQDDNYYVFRQLLKKDASVNLHDADGSYIMHHALNRVEVNLRIVVELARHGGVFDVIDKRDRTPVVCYLDKLISNSPITEADNVFTLFRLFMLRGSSFQTQSEWSRVQMLHKENRDLKLPDFLYLCYKETMKMARSVLVPKWNVCQVARSLVFTSQYGIENHIPHVVLDRLLNKLLKEKFPMYTEILVSNIRSPYLNKKFAEMCCNRENAFCIYEFEELLSISKYLTNMEMLRMMICCVKARPSTRPSSSSRLPPCSIL